MNENTSSSVQSRHPARRGFSFDTASIWVLTITIALATIIFTWSPTLSFLYSKITLVAIGGLIALALYILARLIRGNVIVPPVSLLGALWLVPLAYALSSIFSAEGFSSAFFGTQLEQDTFGFMLLLALVATLTALVFRRTNHYRTFFKTATVAFGIVLISEIVFLILGHVMPNSVSASTNLVGSFMDLGMLAGLAVTCVLLMNRFLRVTGWKRIVLWVVGIGSLIVLALVNLLLLWILVGLVSLGLFIEAILRRRVSIDEAELEGVETLSVETEPEMTTEESKSLIAPLVTLVVALFFIIGGSTIGSALTTAAGTNVLNVRPSWAATFNVGSHTYASSPIFGSGPNTFGTQWLKFRDRTLNQTVFWNVNFNSGIGLIPTSFVTEGLVGVLAWIAFLGLFIVLGLRALLFRTPTDPQARFVSVVSFVGSLYIFALMIFAYPGPVVLVVGFAFLGLFISSLRYAGTRQEWGIIFARNPRVGFLIVFLLTLVLLGSVVAAYIVTERYLADSAYDRASVELSNSNFTAAASDINRSIVFAPTDRAYQLAAEVGLAQMNKIANDSSLTPAQAQQQFQSALTQSVQSALTATKLGPSNYENWVVLGQVYGSVVPLNIDGAYANAKTAYQHAESLSPTDPTLPYTLAQLEISQKNYSAAETDLDQAISLKSDYTQAIFLLAQLKAQEGQAAEALQAAEAAAYFDPNDPTVLFEVGILESANGDNTDAITALAQAVQLNPQYANARYYLAVLYAISNQYPQAIAQLQAVAALSSQNAAAVASDITALQAGKNPFPASQLGALGISQPSISGSSGSTPAATSQSVTK